jgi:hypothetical protein
MMGAVLCMFLSENGFRFPFELLTGQLQGYVRPACGLRLGIALNLNISLDLNQMSKINSMAY